MSDTIRVGAHAEAQSVRGVIFSLRLNAIGCKERGRTEKLQKGEERGARGGWEDERKKGKENRRRMTKSRIKMTKRWRMR